MSSPNITVQIKGGTTQVVTSSKIQVSGGSSANAFGVVNVAGQNNIIAHTLSDTLQLIAGTGIVLTTDNVNNALTIVAAGGSATDQFARDQANAGFAKANTANVTGQAAFDKANTAIYTAAQIRANISNTAPIKYDSSTGIISHELSGVVATTYGNTTFVPTITVNDKGHITSVVNTAIALPPSTDEFARAQANAAFSQANTANVTGQAAFDKANTAIYTAAQIRANISNTAPINFDSATGIVSHADSGVSATTYGNTTFVPTITVDSKGHVTSVVNTAIALPPSTDEFARAQANAAFDKANGAFSHANGSFSHANGSFSHANGAFTQANTATVTGQAAFDKANTAIYTAAQIRANISNTAPIGYDSSTGVISLPSTANGQTLIGNTVSGAFDVATLTQGTGILITNGKGSITIAATGGASGNSFGIIAVAGQSNVVAHQANDVFNLVQGTGIVIVTDVGTNSVTISATGGSATDQYARDKANGAVQTGFVTVNVAGQSDIVADSNTDTLTLVGSGITITTVAGTDTLTIQHPASGVTASGYGDAATVPKFVVDANGHVTSVTNTSIAVAASAITSGIISVARGGTGKDATGIVNGSFLIGNTVNTGFDVSTIAQTAPVIVVNGKGTITLSHASSGVTASGYGAAAQIPVFVVDAFGHITSVTNTAITGLDAAAITTGILSVARGGTGKDATGIVNGSFLIGNTVNTGFDISTIAQTAPVIVTNGKGTVTLSHASTAVVAGTYGGSNRVIGHTVDQFGHLTAVSNVAIDLLPAAAITTGIISVARGGTGKDATGIVNGSFLIGNTVNTGYDVTTIAQTAPVIVTNGKGTVTLSHASSGVTATGYGTLNQIPVFVVDAFGHITAVTNTAIGSLDTGVLTTGTLTVVRGGTGQSSYTNGQILIGNTGSTGLDKATIAQTTPIIVTNLQGSITLSHASTAVVTGTYGGANRVIGYTVDQFGHLTAASNVAIDLLPAAAITTGILSVARGGSGKDATGLVNGSFLIGNTVNTGFDLATIAQSAPVIVTNGQGTITISHARSGVTAAIYGGAAIVPVVTVDANGHVTTATNTSIAIAASQITSGATVNGQILIGNTVSGAFDVNLIAQTAPVIVTNGKGTVTLSHASSGVVASGYGTAAQIPVFVVDAFGHISSVTNTAITGLSTSVLTSGILSVARGGTGKDATGLANGQLLIGNTVNTGFDLTTIAQSSPVIVTNGQGTITISHARSGVTAAIYGGAAIIPVVTVDANGHVTTATNTAIAGLDAAAITTGIISVARGGTGKDATGIVNGSFLIGNTVNTGFDVSTIAQTAPVIVTNGKGTVTLSHASTAVVTGTYGGANRVIGYTVDQLGHMTAASNVAIDLLPAAAITTGIISVARGGTGKDATGIVNGSFLIGNTVNTGFDITTIAQTAPVIVTNGKGTVTLSHASSGVTATGYGTLNQIPVFVVDAFGHITAVTNTAIGSLDTGVLTTGIISVARGGTGKDSTGLVNGAILIGNTVNTGFDLTTIIQGAGIIITNGKGTIQIDATGGAATDQWARDNSNGAFTKANNAVQTGFVTIVVSGQSDVVADSNTDTLTLVAGSGMTITTNAGTDTITLAAAGGGSAGPNVGMILALSRGYAWF